MTEFKLSNRRMVSDFLPHLEEKFGFDAQQELEKWINDPLHAPDDCRICLAKGITIKLSPRDFRIVASSYVKASQRKRGLLNDVSVRIRANGREIPLGRFLTDAPDDAIVTFRNGDCLDYTRGNLLVADKRRKVKSPDKSSVFMGVSATPQGKWAARAFANGRQYHLGTFPKEVDAARAYDAAARRLFGFSARLNFPTSGERSALVAMP